MSGTLCGGIYLYRLEFLPIPQMPVEKVDKPSFLSVPSSSLYILLLQCCLLSKKQTPSLHLSPTCFPQ